METPHRLRNQCWHIGIGRHEQAYLVDPAFCCGRLPGPWSCGWIIKATVPSAARGLAIFIKTHCDINENGFIFYYYFVDFLVPHPHVTYLITHKENEKLKIKKLAEN